MNITESKILRNILLEFILIPICVISLPIAIFWVELVSLISEAAALFFIFSWFGVYLIASNQLTKAIKKSSADSTYEYLSTLPFTRKYIKTLCWEEVKRSIRIGIGGSISSILFFYVIEPQLAPEYPIISLIIMTYTAMTIPVLDHRIPSKYIQKIKSYSV